MGPREHSCCVWGGKLLGRRGLGGVLLPSGTWLVLCGTRCWGLKTAPLLDFFCSEAGRCAAPVCEKSFTEKKVYCRALFLPKKANLTEHPFKEYLCGLN